MYSKEETTRLYAPETEPQPLKKGSILGKMMVFLGCGIFALGSVFAKYSNMTGWQLLYWRYGCSCLLLLVGMPWLKIPLVPPISSLSWDLFWICTVMYLSSVFYFLAIIYVDLSVLVPIYDAVPAYVLIIRCLTGQGCVKGLELLASLLAVVGVVLVAQPDFIFVGGGYDEPVPVYGILYAVLSGILGAFICVLLSKSGSKYHTFTVSMCTAIQGLLFTWPFFFVFENSWDFKASEWYWAIAFCLTINVGMYAWVYGLQLESSLVGGVLTSTESVFGCLFGVWLLDETPNVWTYFGVIFVITAALVIAFHDDHQAKLSLQAASPNGLELSYSGGRE
jgi:drug/metabolite transporter (DMT)-like permease